VQTAATGQTALTLVQEPVERRGRSVGWAIVGYTLLLILVYILLKPRVTSALSTLVTAGSKALGTWVKPEDPIAKLEGTLGSASAPAGSGVSSSSTGGTTEQNAIATAGMVLNAPPPALAGEEGIKGDLTELETKYGTPAELRQKLRVVGSTGRLLAGPRSTTRTLQPLVVAR
jgi:hypothetical protein